MAITRKVVTVGDSEYEIQAFPATKGIRIFKNLAKLIGPALQALSEAKDEDDASVMAISALMNSMDDVAVDELIYCRFREDGFDMTAFLEHGVRQDV